MPNSEGAEGADFLPAGLGTGFFSGKPGADFLAGAADASGGLCGAIGDGDADLRAVATSGEANDAFAGENSGLSIMRESSSCASGALGLLHGRPPNKFPILPELAALSVSTAPTPTPTPPLPLLLPPPPAEEVVAAVWDAAVAAAARAAAARAAGPRSPRLVPAPADEGAPVAPPPLAFAPGIDSDPAAHIGADIESNAGSKTPSDVSDSSAHTAADVEADDEAKFEADDDANTGSMCAPVPTTSAGSMTTPRLGSAPSDLRV